MRISIAVAKRLVRRSPKDDEVPLSNTAGEGEVVGAKVCPGLLVDAASEVVSAGRSAIFDSVFVAWQESSRVSSDAVGSETPNISGSVVDVSWRVFTAVALELAAFGLLVFVEMITACVRPVCSTTELST